MLQRPLLLAHRGLHDDVVQENSLAALAAGAAQLDGVELDVRFSADGEAVIVHDETLERIFGKAHRVGDLSVSELLAIGVPRLREALTAMPADALIDLELKERPTDALFADLCAARGNDATGVVFSSFEPKVLRAIRDHAPDWSLWLNAESEAEADHAAELDYVGVSVAINLLNDASIERWRGAGLEVAAWTARDSQSAVWARDLRLTALCVEGEGITAARAATR